MITVEAAVSDLEQIEKDVSLTDTQKLIKAIKVLVKFLSTMRSNQLLTEEDKKVIKSRKEKK